MKVLGISGTNGAGKDTLAHWLQDRLGWQFVSVSDILRAELGRRGQPIERKNLRELSTELRKQKGLGALVDMSVQQFDNQFSGLVISSIRNPGEVDRIHELGGKIIWIDADPQIRYERIMGRRRGTEDTKTLEQFLAEEQEEMKGTGDPASLDMQAVKDKADINIMNNTYTTEEFIKLAEKSLGFSQNA